MKLQDIQTKTRGRQQPTHHPVILYSIVFLFNEINKAFEYLESVKSLCRILVQLSIGRELLVSMSGERERAADTGHGLAWAAHCSLGPWSCYRSHDLTSQDTDRHGGPGEQGANIQENHLDKQSHSLLFPNHSSIYFLCQNSQNFVDS